MLNVMRYRANLDALSLKKLDENNEFVDSATVANNDENSARSS